MPHSDYVEVEVKLLVDDLVSIGARLAAAGAELITQRIFEANIRYENEAHTFARDGIVLRLRQDTRVRLTYKEPIEQTDADMIRRLEAEVEVDDFEAMALILQKLGYEAYARYEKYRTTYVLGGVEIVLDELPYGEFVELEGEASQIREQMQLLGMGDFPRFHESYMALFDNVRANMNLTFRDLTFENFKGLDVPVNAFERPVS